MKKDTLYKNLLLALILGLTFSVFGFFTISLSLPSSGSPFPLLAGAFLSIGILVLHDAVIIKENRILSGFDLFGLVITAPLIPTWVLFFAQVPNSYEVWLSLFLLYFPGAALLTFKTRNMKVVFVECMFYFLLLLFALPLEIFLGAALRFPAFSIVAFVIFVFLAKKSVK